MKANERGESERPMPNLVGYVVGTLSCTIGVYQYQDMMSISEGRDSSRLANSNPLVECDLCPVVRR